jgi:alpha-1,2-mannosyltransferase
MAVSARRGEGWPRRLAMRERSAMTGKPARPLGRRRGDAVGFSRFGFGALLYGLDHRHRREAGAALLACLIAVAAYTFVSLRGGLTRTIRIEHIDLDVYRLGARVLLDHGNLYGALPSAGPGVSLPFTYPPIAAMLLVPLALLPLALDGLVSIAITVVLLAVVLRTVLRSAGRIPGTALNWSVIVALPLALMLDPVRVTLVDGQIDVALMALVVRDTVGPGVRIGRWRPRGALVGLATAVKLTPAVFVLYFLAHRDRRAAATSLASFALFTAVGAFVAPKDSAQYWGHVVFQTGRIGAAWYTANQSLRAVLTRFGLGGAELTAAWMSACVIVLALAWVAMRRAARRSSPAGVLVPNALAELLVSPISWTHHWVWIAPSLAALDAVGRRSGLRRMRALVVPALVLFMLGPQWFFPHGDDRELRWALWEQMLGGAYVWFGLLILVLAAAPPSRRWSVEWLWLGWLCVQTGADRLPEPLPPGAAVSPDHSAGAGASAADCRRSRAPRGRRPVGAPPGWTAVCRGLP